jgi:lipopolysaccharide exporter
MIAAKGLLGSAAFSSGAKFISRIIGLFSTLILARILTPSDFAMIAIIAIVLHLFDVLSHTGSEQYIVQKSVVIDADLNTAWTLDILLKTSMFFVLLLMAPFVANFFEQENLGFAMQVAAITLIINALKNPGLFLLKRELDYKQFFYLSLVQRIVSFAVVISVALNWQSYWAFVIADIAGALVFTLGSFVVHKFRPSFGLHKVARQWQFSKWLMGKSIVGYLRSQIDTVFVAKFFNAGQLGNYHMARDVAMLPGHNLLGPAIEPLLADFKDYKSLPVNLGERVSQVLCIVALLVVPITTYMTYYPHIIIEVLLGPQWQLAGDILGVMSWLFFYFCFLLVIESALIAVGKVKAIFMFDVVSLVLIGGCLIIYLQVAHDLHELLILRVALGIVSTLMIGFALHRYVPLRLWRIFGSLILASVLAIIALYLTKVLQGLLDIGLIAQFLLTGATFCISYASLILVFLPLCLGMSLQAMLADYRHTKNVR